MKTTRAQESFTSTKETRYFPVLRKIREALKLATVPFGQTGDAVIADTLSSRSFALSLSKELGTPIRAGDTYAIALLHEIAHVVCRYYTTAVYPQAFRETADALENSLTKTEIDAMLAAYIDSFPPPEVFAGKVSATDWLALADDKRRRELVLEELILIRVANENPAFSPLYPVFTDASLRANFPVDAVIALAEKSFSRMPPVELAGGKPMDLISLLREPARRHPNSLKDQLMFILSRWKPILGDLLKKLLGSLDLIAEESKPNFGGGPGPSQVLSFEGTEHEYEAFTSDSDWMPKVVMIAKSTLVWLDQLSKKYQRSITTLDAIPDEELKLLAERGFNALWLIGLWERSHASQRIKQLCGNPEAAASAYALWDYEIAWELGGWQALENLRSRAWRFGIRLAADMVPNHTGLDSEWVRNRPELFMQRASLPFPTYSFNGENLSGDQNIGIWLEDHYYNRSDCAVVFKRVDFRSGDTRYIYHGNDGTSMPWNDTAQIDFLNPEARKAVVERIMHVARNFPIIRFDAAMIMAKKHFRRLWYPEPGHGGDIASRGEYALTRHDFDSAMPNEFWREVVDTCAREAPDTLLLAEAFWMMEGYFVRTLGMHRVYNSAFMNMLKRKENKKYRDTIKNTQEFDKEILKRFVNFMNNPDEETSVAQFGKEDHYFGVCTLMSTLPGLPMFGHGQIEGFTEKYGMEYRRAYYNEVPDEGLIARHRHEIFPILKKRYLFSGVEIFVLYDCYKSDGSVDDNVFAYTNGTDRELALVLYNNEWLETAGTLNWSSPWARKQADGTKTQAKTNLAGALRLPEQNNAYLIMQEQRSDLWYIRNALDLHRNGLKIMLRGFEAQVYLNIHAVVDDERGLYRELARRLRGAGTPNIADSLLDIEFEKLYAAWDRAFLQTSAKMEASPTTEPASAENAEVSLKHCEVQQLFAEKAFSELDLALRRITGLESAETDLHGFTLDFLEACASIQAITKAAEAIDAKIKSDATPTAESLQARLVADPGLTSAAERYPLAKAAMQLCALYARSIGSSGIISAQAANATPHTSDAANKPGSVLETAEPGLAPEALGLWNRLGLTRKIAQLLPEASKPSATTLVSLALLAIQAEREGTLQAGSLRANLAPERVVETLRRFANEVPAFGEALGFNRWEDKLWYNKELAERIAAIAAVALAATKADGNTQEALAQADADIFQPVLALFHASAWQWEELLVAIRNMLDTE